MGLSLEPLQRVVLAKYRSIYPISIFLDNFLGMYAMQTILPLVQTTPIRTVLSSSKYADVDVPVVQSRQLHLAEEMQAVRCDGCANRLEVFGSEGY